MKPRPTVESRLPNSNFIDLPKNQPITYIQAYMPFRYPKWMFWKKNKVYLAVACKNRLYLVDPETPSVTEAEQSIK